MRIVFSEEDICGILAKHLKEVHGPGLQYEMWISKDIPVEKRNSLVTVALTREMRNEKVQ